MPRHASEEIGGFAVTAVDTNGAGDAHVGAFIAGLAAGLTPSAAALRANAAAALAVTRRGPTTAPGQVEVDLLLGDASKATNALGWEPRTKFRELVREMVQEDLRSHGGISH